MNILVCIKRVPDLEHNPFPDTPPRSPAEVQWPGAAWRMNRYDEYAVEAALRLREQHGAARIDALTVGGEDAAEVLRRALGMGVDHGVHIRRPEDPFASPFVIGGLIAARARRNAYGLILCGTMSEDLMQGLVGPIVAGRLAIPCLTSVQTFTVSEPSERIVCEREIEGGRREVLEIALPALVTLQSNPCRPRYPSLSKLLRANQYPLELVGEDEMPQPKERQRVAAIIPPPRTRQGIRLEGDEAEKARQLAVLLRARGCCR